MYFNVTEAEYIESYKIKLRFENGRAGTADLEEYIQHGDIFTRLIDRDNFRKFKVEYGTLTWNNGTIDIAPETLYQKATGDQVILNSGGIQAAG